jgi:hypothetical protein
MNTAAVTLEILVDLVCEDLLVESNQYHAAAGSGKGGQFTSKDNAGAYAAGAMAAGRAAGLKAKSQGKTGAAPMADGRSIDTHRAISRADSA